MTCNLAKIATNFSFEKVIYKQLFPSFAYQVYGSNKSNIIDVVTCPGHRPTTRENTIIMSKWVTQGQAKGNMDHFLPAWEAF